MSANTENTTPNWYALYTRAGFEKKVAEQLRDKGVEAFVPTYTVTRQWSDRKKKIEQVLFSCYTLVRTSFANRVQAMQTVGVVRMVSFNGKAAAIPDEEIDSLRRVLAGTNDVEIIPYLRVGDEVEVIRGPFEGVRGRLIQNRGQYRLVVGIAQIRQALSVEVFAGDVKAIDSSA